MASAPDYERAPSQSAVKATRFSRAKKSSGTQPESKSASFPRETAEHYEEMEAAQEFTEEPEESSSDRSPEEKATARSDEGLTTWRDLEITRESGRFALHVDERALALATIFRQATGEFCFGLFGPWGSGKTTLSRRLALLLESSQSYKKALDSAGIAYGTDTANDLRYAVVPFSAWKYRKPPEIWAFLYETLRRRSTEGGPMERAGRIVRTSLEKTGHWPLVLTLMALLASTAPLSSVVRLVYVALGSSVAAVAVYAVNIVKGGNDPVRQIMGRYATIASYKNTLGLLAVISEDLRNLLIGWIPRPRLRGDGRVQQRPHNRPSHYSAWSALAVFAGCWLVGLLWLHNQSLQLDCGKIIDAKWLCQQMPTINAQWPVLICVFLLWAAFVSFLTFACFVPSGKIDRILLVVDDLDRCSADEIIAIIESLKVLVEDDAVQERLQLLLLADEAILRHAILAKFDDVLSKFEPDNRIEETDRVVREHLEKLFLCRYRLPPMTTVDVQELTKIFASSADAPAHDPGLTGGPTVPPAKPANLNSRSQGAHAGTMALRFSDEEREVLGREVPNLVAQKGRATPRAIKAVIFRYELCRLLLVVSSRRLEQEGILPKDAKPVTPMDLISMLKGTSEVGSAFTDAKLTALLESFAEQVA